MKNYLVGDMSKNWGGLGGPCGASVHVGCGTWGSRGPRTPPKWRSSSRSLVKTAIQGAYSRTSSTSLPTQICLVPSVFHAQPVRSALAGCEASRSVPGETCFLGAPSKTAFCHGISFYYFDIFHDSAFDFLSGHSDLCVTP